VLPDGERAQRTIVGHVSVEEFAKESLVRPPFRISERCGFFLEEPAIQRYACRRGNSSAAASELAARGANDPARGRGKRGVVGLAKGRVTQSAARELRRKPDYRDNAPAAREPNADGVLRCGSGNPIEHVGHRII
jgi:hypothetical protein